MDKISTMDQALQTSEVFESRLPSVQSSSNDSSTKSLTSSIGRPSSEAVREFKEMGFQCEADIKKIGILHPEKNPAVKDTKNKSVLKCTKSICFGKKEEPKNRSVSFSKNLPKVKHKRPSMFSRADTFLSVGDLEKKLRPSYVRRGGQEGVNAVRGMSRSKRKQRSNSSKRMFVVRGVNQWHHRRHGTLSQIDLTRLSKPMQDILKRSTSVKEFALKMEKLNDVHNTLEKYHDKTYSAKSRRLENFSGLLEAEKRKLKKNLSGDTNAGDYSFAKQRRWTALGNGGNTKRDNQGDMAEKRTDKTRYNSLRTPPKRYQIVTKEETIPSKFSVSQKSTPTPCLGDLPRENETEPEIHKILNLKQNPKFQLSNSPILTTIDPGELQSIATSQKQIKIGVSDFESNWISSSCEFLETVPISDENASFKKGQLSEECKAQNPQNEFSQTLEQIPRDDPACSHTKNCGKTSSRHKHRRSSSRKSSNSSFSDVSNYRIAERSKSRLTLEPDRNSFSETNQEDMAKKISFNVARKQQSTPRAISGNNFLEEAIERSPETPTSSRTSNKDVFDHEEHNVNPVPISDAPKQELELAEFVAKARKVLTGIGSLKDPNQRYVGFKIDLHSL